MIIASVRVKASAGKYEELAQGLSSLLGPARTEPGCVDCQLHQDVTDPDTLHLESFWRTEDDLERHVRSAEYMKLLMLIELGATQPTIEFHHVSQTRGLEFVHMVRQG
jgi:quinol monooxygenase YgiN